MSARYRQRDIVLIKVPYQDETGFKVRPVLIISNHHLDSLHEFIGIPIFTLKLDKDKGLFPIPQDQLGRPLKNESALRFNKVGSFNKSKIIRIVNEIHPEFFKIAMEKFKELIL